MKKKSLAKFTYIAAGVLMLVGLVVFIYLNVIQNQKAQKRAIEEKNTSFNTIIAHACEIYPLADAQKLLGDKVKYEDTALGAQSTNDIEISACSYSTPFKNLEELQSAQTSSVLMRSAKTSAGAYSNLKPFKDEKPEGAQTVNGYGELAYWNQSRAQLNVYKEGNWLIFSAGPLNASERQLEDARKLADIIMPKI